MPGTLIVGAQWGDEGKGKVTDLLAAGMDVVARYQGGDNAGHTVMVGKQTFKFHLIPSGILYPQVLCLLGNGMVINPTKLFAEMDELAGKGVDISPRHLKISGQAHLIMPYHPVLDSVGEAVLGKSAIGTTGRGIGPAYTDKAARQGIRVQDTLREDFADQVRQAVEAKNVVLTKLYNHAPLPVAEIVAEFRAHAARLRPYIANVSVLLDDAYRAGKKLLYEGAQGTLLDLDHGTYPFVTSSSCSAGGALTGLGIGPKHIDRVIALVKAYQTRVGSGPFPTELFDSVGDLMVEHGHEYGTTTGRRRRTGWLDLVTLRYSARVNGLQEIALTKLDVLSGLNELKLCASYRYRGAELTEFPTDSTILADCAPNYIEMEGWEEAIDQAASWEAMPKAAREYVQLIEKQVGVAVTIISLGPERDQTILREPKN
jgi:adenylosuccinate synthase